VSAFGYQDKVYELQKIEDGYASRFKKELMNIQYNRSEDPFGWRYEV
jgi:branched-chain amino acid aminotransferase